MNQYTCRIEPGLAGLTETHLKAAYREASKQKISLQEAVLRLGVVSEEELLASAAEKTGMEFSNLDDTIFEQEVLNVVGASTVTHYNIMPLKITDHTLWVATCDPFNTDLKAELELILDTKYQIQFILATSESIKKVIRKSYGIGADTVEQMVTTSGIGDTTRAEGDSTDETKAEEASVIKLVNQILTDAINAGATDIHFEPYEDDLRVRYRTDGILHDAGIPATVKYFRDGITSRIKIMSGLDIAEKRLPQDGRSQINISGQQFDLRMSVLPAKYGEAVNVRILPRGTLVSDLCSLGITAKDAQELSKLIFKPHGIILVTGPTGSGKTTTLYTCMKMLNRTDKKIITIEDPIEYDMSGLVQMQVQAEIGFTFARALRSMLRHDPDIMLVGEIRDLETAETAIRTALTGHLVFSTLHTNSAASAITRLLDMGIEPYLVASSIEGILGQRLVRVICQDCKKPHEPDPEVAIAIKSLSALEKLSTVYRGTGCPKCRFTGYRGRTVISELLIISEEVRNLTVSRQHTNKIDTQAHREGMVSLFQSGIGKVRQGITTYEEILRVTKGTMVLD